MLRTAIREELQPLKDDIKEMITDLKSIRSGSKELRTGPGCVREAFTALEKNVIDDVREKHDATMKSLDEYGEEITFIKHMLGLRDQDQSV